jgi:hypothetical protein
MARPFRGSIVQPFDGSHQHVDFTFHLGQAAFGGLRKAAPSASHAPSEAAAKAPHTWHAGETGAAPGARQAGSATGPGSWRIARRAFRSRVIITTAFRTPAAFQSRQAALSMAKLFVQLANLPAKLLDHLLAFTFLWRPALIARPIRTIVSRPIGLIPRPIRLIAPLLTRTILCPTRSQGQ